MEMDFDIDAVLDQLEKTINQSNTEENEATQNPAAVAVVSSPSAASTTRKSVDELLLLDLDPLAPTQNDFEQDKEEKLERLKNDIQQIFAASAVSNPPVVQTPILPDVISQQEDPSSVTLPVAVEHLEFEVQQEILQHTLDLPSSHSLLPDLTSMVNGTYEDHSEIYERSSLSSSSSDEENQEDSSMIPQIEQPNITKDLPMENEPDLLQRETQSNPVVLHSVDSIVNAATMADLEKLIPKTLLDSEAMESSSELFFTACVNDSNNEEDESIPPMIDQTIDRSSSPTLSSSMVITTDPPTQDFDLVKNILSEIFDKPEEINLNEQTNDDRPTELVNIEPTEDPHSPPVTINNDEDFRFLDAMLESINLTDAEIHQLTPAEIDRVDSLLQEIVNGQQPERETVDGTEEEDQQQQEETIVQLDQALPPVETFSSLPTAAAAAAVEATPVDEELVRVEQEWGRLTEEEKWLGSVAPEWVNDDQAPVCMKCAAKFSITRRRHHCRACGKVFCTGCCSQKVKLVHNDNREDRACNDCIRTINHVEYLWNYRRNNQKPRSSVLRKAGTSLTGSGSTNGSNATLRQGSEHKKSVTFDDGIKPGAETTVSAAATAATNIMSSHKTRFNQIDTDQISSPLFQTELLTTEEIDERIRQLKDLNEGAVEFPIHKNLRVISKIDENGRWIFSSRGLSAVAQDELIFIFNQDEILSANEFISQLLAHIQQIYLDATKGSFVRHLSLSSISNTSSFFSSINAEGFLYFSDPNVSNEIFPELPFLFGILIQRDELPTARCFPIRLLLRLGYEYQSYPWPLFSILHRNAMFTDTQHTIMSLLCDFRSYTYTLPTIRGLTLSIGSQGSVSIRIPRNRYDDLVKSLEQSSPHALSFGVMNINRQLHSKHLITVENSVDQQNETRLFTSNSSNAEQTLIGGNFLVINASLRSRDSPSSSPLDGSFSSSTLLNAKVNTIEDGIMLQLDGDTLKILKQTLRERKDYSILAKAKGIASEENNQSGDGPVIKRTSSEQLVEFIWVDDDNDVNRGVRSPIDHFPMDGIRNSRIHYAGQRSILSRLRWTDLYFIQCHSTPTESFDPTRLADSLARAFNQALTPFLDMLIEGNYRKLGLRVTIDRENASYLAGSNGEQLSAFFLSQLDDQMIPIVMNTSDTISRTTPSLVLELVFYLLD